MRNHLLRVTTAFLIWQVREEDLTGVLGPARFDGPSDMARRMTKPGIAIGLAYTSVGDTHSVSKKGR